MSEIIPDRILFVPPIRSKPPAQKPQTAQKQETRREDKIEEEEKPVFDIPKFYDPQPLPQTTVPVRPQPPQRVGFGWRKLVIISALTVMVIALGIYFFFG